MKTIDGQLTFLRPSKLFWNKIQPILDQDLKMRRVAANVGQHGDSLFYEESLPKFIRMTFTILVLHPALHFTDIGLEFSNVTFSCLSGAQVILMY